MTNREFIERSAIILHHMSLERRGFWRQLIRRWHISDEPLRHDAASLLTEYGAEFLTPKDCQRLGRDR